MDDYCLFLCVASLGSCKGIKKRFMVPPVDSNFASLTLIKLNRENRNVSTHNFLWEIEQEKGLVSSSLVLVLGNLKPNL